MDGRDDSSLLLLVGLGDLAGLGDLVDVAELGLEMEGLLEEVVLVTGLLTACGCQPVLRVRVGGEWTRFTVGLGFSVNKESVLFDLFRDDLCAGGDLFTSDLSGFLDRFVADVSLLGLAADTFSLGGREGAVGDLIAGEVGVDFLLLLSR